MGHKQLNGEIPAGLEHLENLQRPFLEGNDFTGWVPAALAEVPSDDVAALSLPLCETEKDPLADV